VNQALLTALLCAPASAALAADSTLLSLAPDHFRETATVQQNRELGTMTVSTERGFVEKHGPLRTVWDDAYLKATINGTTGQRAFEVDLWFTYNGAARHYHTAQYALGGATREQPVVPVKTESLNCATGECTNTDHYSFKVEEDALRQWVAESPDKPKLWNFKIVGAGLKDYVGVLSTAEMAGLLWRVDEEGGVVRSAVGAAAVPLVPRELGVGGLRIDGTEDSPPRMGVLLTAVNRGSVAQRAGLLVGDMIFEIDGRAVRSNADIEAALARTRTQASVSLRFYRGLDARAVTLAF
jgi:hypothetical protein